LLGFIANGISVLILESEKDKNLNIKAAYLHLLGDALTSIAVVVGAILIWKFNFIWVDSAVTILISIYLLVHTLKLLKESVTILMQMSPSHLNVNDIKNQLLKIDTLENIHHIHLWNLTDKLIHFECHINLKENLKVSETEAIYVELRKILHNKFDVEHVTIQFEYSEENNCKEC
jgi:cobalt-zinc-cadmium efflux system protein